nr:ABC transporter G family member 20-like [Dermatophagoides farinae]
MVTISDNDSNINKNVVYENYGFYDDQAETKTTTTKLDNNHNRNKNESNHHNQLSPIAVKIRNVFLSYGNHQVLKGVNMNVPVKQIYGLLGPSGCGKTSLLRCVIGIRQPDSGQISVYGQRPGTPESGIPGPGIGYTPQEVALFADFTIAETFEYFGKLFHMTIKNIDNRTEQLIQLLNLPEKDRYINNLSGGQKRRVSLAVALIHSPPLLILDEPTVGVDPVLRQNIWDYLRMLTEKMNLTIIITTQYIEEARSADIVSFMRNGRLMAEKNPTILMEQLQLSTLESVFLHLCQSDSIDENQQQQVFDMTIVTNNNDDDDNSHKTSTINPFQHQPKFAFIDRIRALNWKNITGIRRNLSMLIIQFLMPSFQCLLNFTCLGPDPYDIPVAIYNTDRPPILSGLFINNLNNNTFRLIEFDNYDEAIQQVQNGFAWALLSFQYNYTRIMQLIASDDNIDDIRLPQIDLHLDTTNYVITNTIQKELWITFNQTMAMATELFTDTNQTLNPVQQNPFNYDYVYGMKSPKMSEFMAPGLISMAIFFAAMALTAITLVLERKDGIFERTLVAGVKTFEFIVSQISTQLLVLAVQVLLSVITMLYIIDVENQGSVMIIYLITLIQGMCGMALGLVVSAFSQNESQALALAMASFLPVSIISGIFWPVEAMPKYMKPISYFGPQTYALVAMRSVMSRGWDLTYPLVIIGVITPSIWFIMLIISASIGFHLISFN